MARPRLFASALAFWLVCSGALKAGQPPVFRSGVDLVTVESLVVDGEGRPVTGLGKEDFVLTVDGEPRAIDSFEFVASQTGASPSGASPAAAVRDVSSNDVSVPGRLVLIVADRANIRQGDGRYALAGLASLVESLSAQDRVGLYTFPAGGPQVDLTNDRGAILAALPRIRGLESRQADPTLVITASQAFRIDRRFPGAIAEAVERNCIGMGTPSAPDPEQVRAGPIEQCTSRVEATASRMVREVRARNEDTMNRMEALLESLRFIDGPKTIVYVSQGLALDTELRGRLKTFGSRIAAAGASLYAVQIYQPPMDALDSGLRPDWDEDRSFRAEGLSYLASVSGGALFQPAAGLGVIGERIARELSARYLLGFQVSPRERDARAHRIEVKLRHERGRILRHRTEFTLDATPRRFTRAVETLTGALSEPLPIAALPLRVGTYVVPESTSTYKVLLSADVGPASEKPVASQVAFEIVDVDGRRVGFSEESVPLPDDLTRPQALRYTAAIRLAPGRYRLKLAAKDANGRLGSVDHPFLVEAAGTLDVAVGSLMLYRTIGQGPAVKPELVFDLSSRDLGFGAHVIAHASRAPVLDELTAVLEVTDVREQVSRFNRTMAVSPGGAAEQRAFEARIPTTHWPPGAYVAQVKVLRAGQPVATLSRSLTLRDAAGPVEEGTESEASSPAGTAVALTSLVDQASSYVSAYAERMSSTVAEERYVQAILDEIAGTPMAPRDQILAWRDDASRARERVAGVSGRRQIRSDLLMVKTRAGLYTNYRDVAEVDGKPVRERDKRALALFTASADQNGATLRRVAQEGARYNLGNLRRTINVPTLPLFALHPAHIKRFTFERGGEELLDGTPTTIVRFRERHFPTFIQTARGDDVFTTGRLWIAADGRVLKTALALEERESGMQVRIDVRYADVASLGLLMPVEMRERYANLPGDSTRVIEGRATYDNFRKFAVTTEEQR